MKNVFSILTAFFLYIQLNACPLNCTTAISNDSFKSELKKITAHDFDEAKKEATEKLLLGKCFTSEQVKKILEQLSFEEDKLELAKKAFPQVVDKQNFGIISTVFEFDSAKQELNKFILDSK